ncbi:unnamed protein product [Phytomonas sp. Hart1]|nr:unnamed protein product [Phytomonas sp. Hart1]|eukprot:CCW67352.1 unnamed protein product [Phytomonas sp. isolate Hart1]
MQHMSHDGDSNPCGFFSSCFSSSGRLFLTATSNGLRAVSLIRTSTGSVSPANPSVQKSNARMAYPVEPPSPPICPLPSTQRTTNERTDSLPTGTDFSTAERPFTVRHGSTFLAASTSLWRSPVRVVAVAGDSPVVAVLFEHTAAAEYEGGHQPLYSSPHSTGPSTPRPRSSSTFLPFKGSPHVHLFDAASGVCLVELYFRGALACTLRANTHLLIVGMSDCFHVINIRTLAHLRKQSVPNLISDKLLSLSQIPLKVYTHPPLDEELRGKRDVANDHPKEQTVHEAWHIAYPSQPRSTSTGGIEGTVRVLTISLPSSYSVLHSAPAPVTPMPNSTTVSSLTPKNPKHLRRQELSPSLVLPGARVGTIDQSYRVITPHSHPLAVLQLSMDGALLASASVLGSTVKLMDAVHGIVLCGFQRGHLRATVHALAFSPNARSLAALSSSGTLHLFHCAMANILDDRGKLGGGQTRHTLAMSNSKSSPFSNILNSKKKRAFNKKVVCPLLPNTLAAIPRLNSSRSRSHSSVTYALSMRPRAKAADSLCFGKTPENSVMGSSGTLCRTAKFLPSMGNYAYCMCFSADERYVWVAQQRGTPVVFSAAGTNPPPKAFTRTEGNMKRSSAPTTRTPVNTDTLVGPADASTATDTIFGSKDSHVVYASLQRFDIDNTDLFANEIYNVKS